MRAPSVHPGSEPSPVRLALAFAAVYVIWGSTYLAIRFAIETIPPLLMAGVRFAVAGGLLYAWLRARGVAAPSMRQWRWATLVSSLMLLGGNGAVVLAEQWIPSGLAALLVASVPLWMVLLDWRWGARVKPSTRVVAGLVAGFLGVGLLVGAPGVGGGGVMELVGAGLVLTGAVFWAAGSLVSRYTPSPPRPRMWVAMQMLVGGCLFLVVSVVAGEWGRVDPSAVTVRSAAALLYLVVFGSLVAYAAYIWLLGVAPPAKVATYAYVNPVVALFLGWLLAAEPLGFRSVLAAAIIVGAVVVITAAPRRTGAVAVGRGAANPPGEGS